MVSCNSSRTNGETTPILKAVETWHSGSPSRSGNSTPVVHTAPPT